MITCQQVYDALEESIEKRWKIRILNPDASVPYCQLCWLFAGDGCKGCPLQLIDGRCDVYSLARRNPWKAWCTAEDSGDPERMKIAAQEMVDVLTYLRDFYFPEGWND